MGHVDIRTPDLHTGLTAIIPYPASVEERKLFIGRFSIDGGDAMSGLGVAEDFGTFSSPIVLAPTPVVGRVYESLIRHSLGRDTGLSTVAGWPPVVVGIDDTVCQRPRARPQGPDCMPMQTRRWPALAARCPRAMLESAAGCRPLATRAALARPRAGPVNSR